MPLSFPVDAALLHVFARSVADHSPAYRDQLFSDPGQPVTAPLTFTRAVAEQFDPEREMRRRPNGELVPEGGPLGRLHAEQHFEYVRALRAGERLSARTSPGATWSKVGRAGTLDFEEMHTDFVDDQDQVVVRTRRVSVQVRQNDDH